MRAITGLAIAIACTAALALSCGSPQQQAQSAAPAPAPAAPQEQQQPAQTAETPKPEAPASAPAPVPPPPAAPKPSKPAATPVEKATPPPPPPPPPEPIVKTVPSGTPVAVVFLDGVSSAGNKAGDSFRTRVAKDVTIDGMTVIPAGSVITGTVVEAVSLKKIGGKAKLTLDFTHLELPSGGTA